MMTSVARTERSLQALNSVLPESKCTHHMLALDWSEIEPFLHAVEAHLARTESPDLVVAWTHDDELGIRLAERLAESMCHFFHVVGSVTADPARIAASPDARFNLSKVVYHRIILGYVDAGKRTRWLTNDEISAGVIDAIERSSPEHIVGMVRP